MNKYFYCVLAITLVYFFWLACYLFPANKLVIESKTNWIAIQEDLKKGSEYRLIVDVVGQNTSINFEVQLVDKDNVVCSIGHSSFYVHKNGKFAYSLDKMKNAIVSSETVVKIKGDGVVLKDYVIQKVSEND